MNNRDNVFIYNCSIKLPDGEGCLGHLRPYRTGALICIEYGLVSWRLILFFVVVVSNIGVIQYFFQHTVTIQSPTGGTVDLPYTLACIHWYKVHPNARFYFGLPIQVCLPSFEIESVGAFMPVSRIDSVCVVANLGYDLKTPNGKERVTVAVPLDVKLHVWRTCSTISNFD